MTPSASARAAVALTLVESVQRRMVEAMQALEPGTVFAPTTWLRDDGRHGGGRRFGAGDTRVFDRASVNVSQVHYDDEPTRPLGSATALSTIIHPAHPLAPSIHLHLSFTELRAGRGYWRVMADLNPSHAVAADTARFRDALRPVFGTLAARAEAEGDRYFWIPALERHRGAAHFYLEDHDSGSFDTDAALARAVGEAAVDVYAAIVRDALAAAAPPTAAARAQQLAYHTLYLFQVLTLDRGTTSGLLVHDQNDVGIMGSLPSHVDRALLASWVARVSAPQDALVGALVACLAATADRSLVDEPTKRALAEAVRAHYRAHPEALALQAAASVVPPTVDNHRA